MWQHNDQNRGVTSLTPWFGFLLNSQLASVIGRMRLKSAETFAQSKSRVGSEQPVLDFFWVSKRLLRKDR
jgi:hypothetical protein